MTSLKFGYFLSHAHALMLYVLCPSVTLCPTPLLLLCDVIYEWSLNKTKHFCLVGCFYVMSGRVLTDLKRITFNDNSNCNLLFHNFVFFSKKIKTFLVPLFFYRNGNIKFAVIILSMLSRKPFTLNEWANLQKREMECYATPSWLWRAAIYCGTLWLPLPPSTPLFVSLSYLRVTTPVVSWLHSN